MVNINIIPVTRKKDNMFENQTEAKNRKE